MTEAEPQSPALPLPESDDEPFRLINLIPKRKRKSGRAKMSLKAEDLKLLETVVHREEYTRKELASKFGLTLKQLQRIIRDHGWGRNDGLDHEEDCEPLPHPDPSVFIACPYRPGSEGKIWMLQERFAKRLPLWHPKDRSEKLPPQSGTLE